MMTMIDNVDCLPSNGMIDSIGRCHGNCQFKDCQCLCCSAVSRKKGKDGRKEGSEEGRKEGRKERRKERRKKGKQEGRNEGMKEHTKE